MCIIKHAVVNLFIATQLVIVIHEFEYNSGKKFPELRFFEESVIARGVAECNLSLKKAKQVQLFPGLHENSRD